MSHGSTWSDATQVDFSAVIDHKVTATLAITGALITIIDNAVMLNS